MSSNTRIVIYSCVSAVLGLVVGASMTFLAFAAELGRGTEFTVDGKKVLCIRTE